MLCDIVPFVENSILATRTCGRRGMRVQFVAKAKIRKYVKHPLVENLMNSTQRGAEMRRK